MAKRNFANKITSLVILMFITIALLPNASVSGSHWITRKNATFQSSQFENLDGAGDGTYSIYGSVSGTTMDLRATADFAWTSSSWGYMNANWDTSRSGSSGKYYGSAGKIYRAIVYYDAYVLKIYFENLC